MEGRFKLSFEMQMLQNMGGEKKKRNMDLIFLQIPNFKVNTIYFKWHWEGVLLALISANLFSAVVLTE